MFTHNTRPRRLLGAGLGASLVLAAAAFLAAPADADVSPISDRTSTGVTADALPTVQIDGVVWSQAVVGNTVYAGGSFANARPAGAAPGSNLTPRGNLLAYNLTTGELITSFAPTLNAQVKSVTASPDGSRIYVGGAFTTADGQNRYRLAAYSTSTGALIASWHPGVDATVNSITATNDVVYVGGIFGQVNGIARTRLAALSATTGATLGWAPTADGTVNAVQVTPDGRNVVLGGAFQNVNGATSLGLASVDAITGTSVPFAANQVVKDYGSQAAILSLSTDGRAVYGTGYVFGSPGNFEGAFSANPSTGAINWLADCHGDTYGAFGSGAQVYVVSHEHYCANIGAFPDTNPRSAWYRSTAFTANATGTVQTNGESGYANFAGQPSPSLVDWFPTVDTGTYTGQAQGSWAVTGNSQYVVEGGEFLHVNGAAQQGLVRFAVPSVAPNKRGPQDTSAGAAPTVTAPFNTVATVSWPSNWDQDDATLTYQLYRDGAAAPVYTTTAVSTFWNRPTLTYRDATLTAGTTYQYSVQAVDPFGNTVRTANVPVTTPTNAPAAAAPSDAYGKAVYNLGPALDWRLDDTSGRTAADVSDYRVPGSYVGGVTPGAASPVSGSTGTAVSFDGSTGSISSTRQYANPTTYTAQLWFRTTSTRGGKLIGFGSSQTGNSASYDRHVYMTNNGQLVFGAYPGAAVTLTSPASYNDGSWHFVTATQGAAGMRLFVDGAQVGANTTTGNQSYSGYWRVGGDTLSGWPSQPSSANFAGTIDEVAVFLSPLTAVQVRAEYKASPAAANQPPVAAFASSCTSKGSCTTNGSTSSDPDGSIRSYAWTFGDGSTGSGVSPVHQYTASGTYPITLTVADDSGATASTTSAVTVTVPVNSLPTAAFTPTCTNLDCTVDASASVDSDGSITSYAWDLGDSTSGTGVTASHSYGAPGTYPVTLTVTDDQGAATATTRSVTVSGVATYAADAFGRTTTGGWGAADRGGSWTVSGGASSFATGGGIGTMKLAAGSTLTAALNGVSQVNTLQTVDLTPDKMATGNGYQLSLRSRVNATSSYQVKVRLLPAGVVHLVESRIVAGTETTFREVNVPGVTYTVGDTLRFQAKVTGDGTTTTLAAKVWTVGTTVPASPQLTLTDAEVSLQGPGAVGVQSYLSSTATNAPVTMSVDNYTATSS